MKKNTRKKLYIVFIILTILASFALMSLGKKTYATEWNMQISKDEETTGILDGSVGFVASFIKVPALAVLTFVKGILVAVTYLGSGSSGEAITTPADIIFNGVSLTTVNFFSTSSNTYINNLQTSVAQWYYLIRNISVIVLLGILIYVGIRMAISTVASEQVKYKKMLQDWIVSLLLVYVLQYIMIFVIDINNALVNMLGKAFGYTAGGSDGPLQDAMSYLWQEAWSVSFTQGVGCTILYGVLIMMTFLFLILYLKRVIITAFLIIISPLITITYSLDKMGDGKSQALNNWLKEFCYNILIQPFHCIIYGALVMTSITALSTEKSLGATVMSIVALVFMYKAEDLVKKIFGVQPSSLGSAIAGGAMALTAMNLLKKKSTNSKQSTGKFGNDKAPTISNDGKGVGTQQSQTATNNVNNASNGNSNGTNGTNGTNSAGNANDPYQSGNATNPKSAARKRHDIASSLAQSVARGSVKVGAAAAGAMLGLGTGDLKGAIAGGAVGGSVANSIETAKQNFDYDTDTRHNEKVTASEYLEWAQYQPQFESGDLDGLTQRSSDILNADLSKVALSESDLKYRKYMEGLQKQYEAGGEKSAAAKEHVLNTLRAVQSGDLEPKWTIADRARNGFFEVGENANGKVGPRIKQKEIYESQGGYSRNTPADTNNT